MRSHFVFIKADSKILTERLLYARHTVLVGTHQGTKETISCSGGASCFVVALVWFGLTVVESGAFQFIVSPAWPQFSF